MAQPTPSIVWFRNDLRLGDNPALVAAVRRGGPVIPVFICAQEEEGDWPPGAASRWWLHQSLRQLSNSLETCGARLVLRRGSSLDLLRALVAESGTGAVYWNRRYEPAALDRDRRIERKLQAIGCAAQSFDAALLLDPFAVRNKSGLPFRVFTAYWRCCLGSLNPARPLPAPRKLIPPSRWPASISLGALGLEPRPNWAAGLATTWQPGEARASSLAKRFCWKPLGNYRLNRDRPDLFGTSRLSPHMHFGEISPRQIWDRLRRADQKNKASGRPWRNSQFVTELGWREFAHHLLCHFPHTPDQPLRQEFRHFAWSKNPLRLKAWQRGKTGYPLVDAGMRQLWVTGGMHNRVRMVVASFLIKHLLLRWQDGARWFWDTLVDADLANNTLGWQWTAGCGADAAPFFRIFNPVAQGEKFDPHGDFVRQWVPELARLSAKWIHKPWQAPQPVLHDAKVMLGRNYPFPIVNHNEARSRALAAFAKLRSQLTARGHTSL